MPICPLWAYLGPTVDWSQVILDFQEKVWLKNMEINKFSQSTVYVQPTLSFFFFVTFEKNRLMYK